MLRIGPFVAPTGAAGVDDVRVDGAKVVDVEAMLGAGLGEIAGQENVAGLGELQRDLAPGGLGQVEGDRQLAAVRDLVEWVRTVFGQVEHVFQRPLRVTRRRLSLDHLGPEIGQNRSCDRDKRPRGNLENTDPSSGFDMQLPLAQRRAATTATTHQV